MRPPVNLEYLLYAINASLTASKGMFIVVLAWLTLDTTHSLQSVGLVMVTWSAISFVVGPIVGVYIDQIEKRLALAGGQILGSFSVLLPLASNIWYEHSILFLYLTGVIWGIAILFVVGSLDALLQSISEGKARRKFGQRASSVRQMGLVIGAGTAGLVIEFMGTNGALLMTSVLGAIPALLVFAFPKHRTVSTTRNINEYLNELRDGMVYCIGHAGLRSTACIIVISFSVGQLTNALLVSFVVDDLAAGSDVFGWMDAGWSLGAFAVALVIIFTNVLGNGRYVEILALLCIGILTMIFSQIDDVALALTVHVMMGGAYSVARIRSDASLVELCRMDMIGRVRLNIQAMIGFFGICTYAAPSLFNIDSARWLYLIWGIMVCLSSVLLFTAKATKELSNDS